MLRVGIVGAGFAGRYHYECWKRIYGVQVQVVGVMNRTPEVGAKFATARGIAAFASFDELLKHVDVVDICSPPYVHEEQMVKAAEAGKDIIVEKPLTGYYGPPDREMDFCADGVSRSLMLAETIASLRRIADAASKSGCIVGYAENFIYGPAIQKECELITRSRAQILRMIGEEAHNGSESPVYGIWRYAGGGSLIGKGCHPLGALLYFKRIEGLARHGRSIRPVTVTARVHEITRLPAYQDKGFLRTDYRDVEDYGFMHVVFEDGTIGDVVTSELVLGGISDWVEVCANNHRAKCHLSPTGLLDAYNPSGPQFKDVYLMEKISTKEGWVTVAPDENWSMGYQPELQDFAEAIQARRQPQSNLALGIDTTLTIYAAYVSAESRGAEVAIPTDQFAGE